MKTLQSLLLTLLFIGRAAASDTVIAEFPLSELGQVGQPKAATVVVLPDSQPALKVENPGPGPLQATLLTIKDPKITSSFYAITGEVRTGQVEGGGYLEMWNHFGEKGAYFTRTLAESGKMGKLRNDADWRPFVLPFNSTAAGSTPSQLIFNVHLKGKAEIYLRSIKLIQMTGMEGVAQHPGDWWSNRIAGLVGGLGGALVGCLAGLIEWLAARGKAERFVVSAVKGLIALGIGSALAGLSALVPKQPYGVWYPLLLLGLLCAGIFPFRLRRYQQSYRESELRRMTSLDLAAR